MADQKQAVGHQAALQWLLIGRWTISTGLESLKILQNGAILKVSSCWGKKASDKEGRSFLSLQRVSIGPPTVQNPSLKVW